MVTFLTYTIGPAGANLFKVANDAALFFYRIIIKTIGIADTSLFAHIEAAGKKHDLMPFAFKKITTKVAGLVIPFLGIICWIGFSNDSLVIENTFVFQAFFIMALGYIIETLFLPYERILEVKRRYVYLTLGYIPYVIMLILLLTGNIIPYIGLLGSITLIHVVRLVSISIIACLARHDYKLRFPVRFLRDVLFISIIVIGMLWFLLPRAVIPYILKKLFVAIKTS